MDISGTQMPFAGTVFVLSGDNALVTSGHWAEPGDEAADEALKLMGWNRTGPWCVDPYGRRSASLAESPTIRPGEASWSAD